MYPVIIDFGLVDIFGFQFHLAIYSFGLMLVVAFYTCYYFLDHDLKELGYDESVVKAHVPLFIKKWKEIRSIEWASMMIVKPLDTEEAR